MSKLFLMMGAPGSGKSTYIKRFLTEKDIYISRDKIRFSLLSEGEDYFAHENEVFDTFIQSIKNGLQKYDRVFADASHLNQSSRAKVINKVGQYANEINVIWLRTSLMECYKRNDNREGREKVPKSTIKSMYDSIQEPSAKEGIDTVYIVDDKTKELKILELGKPNKENFIF